MKKQVLKSSLLAGFCTLMLLFSGWREGKLTDVTKPYLGEYECKQATLGEKDCLKKFDYIRLELKVTPIKRTSLLIIDNRLFYPKALMRNGKIKKCPVPSIVKTPPGLPCTQATTITRPHANATLFYDVENRI